VAEATLSSKYQIVIPREAREAIGVKAGDKLLIVPKDGKILIMRRPKSFAKALKGIARGVYPDGYIDAERNSWD